MPSNAARSAAARATVRRWLELGLPPLLPHVAAGVTARLPWSLCRDVLAEIGSAKAMRFVPALAAEPAHENLANALGVLRTMPELDGQDGRAALAAIDRRLSTALAQTREAHLEGVALAARLARVAADCAHLGDGQTDALGRLMDRVAEAAASLQRLFPAGPGQPGPF